MFIVWSAIIVLTSTSHAQLVAVPLPDPMIAGFKFPEAEAQIVGWVNDMARSPDPIKAKAAFDSVHLHGWGIWTGLTTETDQVMDGQKVHVFETWYTPNDLPLAGGQVAKMKALARRRSTPRPLHQFERLQPARSKFAAVGPAIGRVAGFVKYDPSAAEQIVGQGLLEVRNLNMLLASGANAIPPFPATSVSLKPVFQLMPTAALVDGRYFQLPVWSGPPAILQGWGPEKWTSSVWIDIQNGGAGSGKVDAAPKPDGSTRTDDTTYPASSLVNYRLSADDAANWNTTNQGGNAKAGDLALLVAMHVTTKEITRWTWQTFWWTPAPDNPPLPSSSEIASLRPKELGGAPRNYAMSLGYSMVSPPQPYVGGSSTGESVYAYNPWLEARFTPPVLPDSKPGVFNGQVVSNNFGVQTNCMSCHGSANYNPNNISTAPNYTGDRYVDLDDARFVGTLKVDFLWSLPGNAR